MEDAACAISKSKRRTEVLITVLTPHTDRDYSNTSNQTQPVRGSTHGARQGYLDPLNPRSDNFYKESGRLKSYHTHISSNTPLRCTEVQQELMHRSASGKDLSLPFHPIGLESATAISRELQLCAKAHYSLRHDQLFAIHRIDDIDSKTGCNAGRG